MAESKFTTEETLALLQAKSKEIGESFTIKIYRKRGALGAISGGLEHTASVTGATLHHCANSEQWLHRFVGGGSYGLAIYAPQDPTKIIGAHLHIQIQGPPRSEPDWSVFTSRDWQGPPILEFPDPKILVPQAQQMTTVAMPQGFPQSGPTSPTLVPGAGMPGAFQPSYQPFAALPPQPSPELELLKAQLAQQQAQTQQLIAQLNQSQREKEQIEAQRREEQLRRENDAKLAVLERKLDQLSAAQAQPRVEAKNAIVELLPFLAPVLEKMMASGETTRQMMLQMQQAQSQQQTQWMMELSKKPSIDPQLQAMLDRTDRMMESMRKEDPASHSLISQMADAMGGMTNMMVSSLQAITESGLGGGKPDDPVGLKVVKEIAKAIESFGAASAGMAKRKVRLPPPRQLQGGRPTGATATGPVTPAAQKAQPAPLPKAAEATPEVNPLDEIEDRIRNGDDPEQIAIAFADSLANQLVQNEINKEGGVLQVFQARLGDWIDATENMGYAQALLKAVNSLLAERGILVEETEEKGSEENGAEIEDAEIAESQQEA